MVRAAVLSTPPASRATPASPAAPAASSSALTARSSGRALGGLQRGAECRTRGELDEELAALCWAVLAPLPPLTTSRRLALMELPGTPRTFQDLPGGGAVTSARGCPSVRGFEAGLAARAAEGRATTFSSAAACGGSGSGGGAYSGGACSGGVCGGGVGGGGSQAVGVGAEGREGGSTTREEPLCFGAAAAARRLPLFPLSLPLDAGCLGWLHCTTPTPTDLRLFFVREELAGNVAEMAGEVAEVAVCVAKTAATATQEAATTTATAAAASSSAAAAAFVRRGGCRKLAAAAQLHATRDTADQISVEVGAAAGRGGGCVCTSAALTTATLSTATVTMATIAGACCISTPQRSSSCCRLSS